MDSQALARGQDAGPEVTGVVFHGPGDLRLETRAARRLGQHDVRIRVAYAGICGSDLSLVSGDWPTTAFGRFLGHEASGVVAEVGGGVADLGVGARVTWLPLGPCGLCAACREGHVSLCERPARHDGSWADSLVVPRSAVYELPAGVDLRTGALAEPLACALTGYEQASPRLAEDVVVVGAGTLGLMLVALAAAGGARSVVAVMRTAAKDSIAHELGATATVRILPEPAATRAEVIAAIGREPDVVFEAAGLSASSEIAVALPGAAGRVVTVGAGHLDARMVLEVHDVFRRGLTVSGSNGHGLGMRRAVRLLSMLRLDGLVTDVFPLEDYEDALRRAAGGGVKVLLQPTAAVDGDAG